MGYWMAPTGWTRAGVTSGSTPPTSPMDQTVGMFSWAAEQMSGDLKTRTERETTRGKNDGWCLKPHLGRLAMGLNKQAFLASGFRVRARDRRAFQPQYSISAKRGPREREEVQPLPARAPISYQLMTRRVARVESERGQLRAVFTRPAPDACRFLLSRAAPSCSDRLLMNLT